MTGFGHQESLWYLWNVFFSFAESIGILCVQAHPRLLNSMLLNLQDAKENATPGSIENNRQDQGREQSEKLLLLKSGSSPLSGMITPPPHPVTSSAADLSKDTDMAHDFEITHDFQLRKSPTDSVVSPTPLAVSTPSTGGSWRPRMARVEESTPTGGDQVEVLCTPSAVPQKPTAPSNPLTTLMMWEDVSYSGMALGFGLLVFANGSRFQEVCYMRKKYNPCHHGVLPWTTAALFWFSACFLFQLLGPL